MPIASTMSALSTESIPPRHRLVVLRLWPQMQRSLKPKRLGGGAVLKIVRPVKTFKMASFVDVRTGIKLYVLYYDDGPFLCIFQKGAASFSYQIRDMLTPDARNLSRVFITCPSSLENKMNLHLSKKRSPELPSIATHSPLVLHFK